MDHGLRRARLAERLGELELEALIVTRLPNVRYLTGFTGSNAQLVIAADGSAVFLTDGRYGAQSSHEVPDLPRTVYRQDYPQPLVEACRTLGATRVGFERHAITYEGVGTAHGSGRGSRARAGRSRGRTPAPREGRRGDRD